MPSFALDQVAGLLVRPDAIPVVLMVAILTVFSIQSSRASSRQR